MNAERKDVQWHPNMSLQYFSKLSPTTQDQAAAPQVPLPSDRAGLSARIEASLARTPEAFPCFDFQYPPLAFSERSPRSRSYESLWRQPSLHGPRAALYVHIPFCRARCSFCYFTVAANRQNAEIDEYLDALEQEMAQLAPFVRDREIESVYWGGGTPTYLNPAQIERLMASLTRHFDLSGSREFTIESTPTLLDETKLVMLRKLGLTRLSMGIQTFDDATLKRLNRSFERQDIERVVAQARHHGVQTLNLDLMYGLPQQTLNQWHQGLDRVLEMRIEGCTLYSLDVHESTQFFRKQDTLELPTAEVQAQMYREAVERLEAAGYTMINRNIFALDPDSYQHQNRRWENLPLIALGASAQSYAAGVSYQNYASIDQYVDALSDGESAIERAVWLDPGEEFYREAVCRLRFSSLDLTAFAGRNKLPLSARFGTLTAALTDMGYLQGRDGHLRLSPQGRDYGNLISMYYFSDHRKQCLANHPGVQQVRQLQALRIVGLTEDAHLT